MKSCIYTGRVRHRRFLPRPHGFSYSLFMMYVDLAELPLLFSRKWFWSTRRMSLAWFRRKDHFGDPKKPLDESVRDLVWERTGRYPTGPIRLLTHFRYFGYCFNPVSFYYCFDESGSNVETIVAEVSNTPWGEKHCYVLSDKMNHGNKKLKQYRFGKDFHVSPFMQMDVNYDWRFIQPGDRLNVHMENYQAGEEHKKIFDATMVMQKQPITSFALARVLIMYPFMSFKVIGGIYYQALKMWLKRMPFYPHPRNSYKSLKTSTMVDKS